MNSKVKNISAVIAIALLICMASIVPIVSSQIIDSRINKKVKYIEGEIYSIKDGEEKSIAKRMEEISQCVEGREYKAAYVPIYINETMYEKVSKEYRKWRKIINRDIEILNTKFDLDSEIDITPDVTLYWEYNANISFYVCNGKVKDKTEGVVYDLSLYIDKDTYKILYMYVWSSDLQQKVEDFWGSGDDEKYRHNGPEEEGKKHLSNFLKGYYNIQEKDFQAVEECFYSAKIFGALEWSILETGGGLEFGIGTLADELVDSAKYYVGNSNSTISE